MICSVKEIAKRLAGGKGDKVLVCECVCTVRPVCYWSAMGLWTRHTHTQHSFFTILYTKQYYCTMSPFGLPYEHRQTTCLLRRPVCAEFLALLFFSLFPLQPTIRPTTDRPAHRPLSTGLFLLYFLAWAFATPFGNFGSEPTTTTAILFYFCGICITLVVEACVCVIITQGSPHVTDRHSLDSISFPLVKRAPQRKTFLGTV